MEAALEAARPAASAKGSGHSEWKASQPGPQTRDVLQTQGAGGGGRRRWGDSEPGATASGPAQDGRAEDGEQLSEVTGKGDATLGGARAGHGRTLVSIAQIGPTLSWLQP